jgi:hypothetical protein
MFRLTRRLLLPAPVPRPRRKNGTSAPEPALPSALRKSSHPHTGSWSLPMTRARALSGGTGMRSCNLDPSFDTPRTSARYGARVRHSSRTEGRAGNRAHKVPRSVLAAVGQRRARRAHPTASAVAQSGRCLRHRRRRARCDQARDLTLSRMAAAHKEGGPCSNERRLFVREGSDVWGRGILCGNRKAERELGGRTA